MLRGSGPRGPMLRTFAYDENLSLSESTIQRYLCDESLMIGLRQLMQDSSILIAKFQRIDFVLVGGKRHPNVFMQHISVEVLNKCRK